MDPYRLASLHNVRWTIKLVEEMQGAIRSGMFAAFRDTFLSGYTPPDPAVRDEQRADETVLQNEVKPFFDVRE